MINKQIYYLRETVEPQKDAEIKFTLEEKASKIKFIMNPIDGEILIDNNINYNGSLLSSGSEGIRGCLEGFEKIIIKEGYHSISIKNISKETIFADLQLIIEYGNDDEINFKEKAIKTLKEEAEKLDSLRERALENQYYADYKLLINNYKQVIELINELENKSKVDEPKEIKLIVDIPNDISEVLVENYIDKLNKCLPKNTHLIGK